MGLIVISVAVSPPLAARSFVDPFPFAVAIVSLDRRVLLSSGKQGNYREELRSPDEGPGSSWKDGQPKQILCSTDRIPEPWDLERNRR